MFARGGMHGTEVFMSYYSLYILCVYLYYIMLKTKCLLKEEI